MNDEVKNAGIYRPYQCVNDQCRFRFPAAANDPRAASCPLCGAECRQEAPHPLAKPITPKQSRFPFPIIGVLDNIRSAYNVGSIFRAADGAGFSRLILTGFTPTPRHPKVGKTALGAAEALNWTTSRNGVDAIQQLKEDGFYLVGLEANEFSLPLMTWQPPSQPLALVVGNEKCGIDPAILALCHQLVAIPMRGVKASLNVAVAFGIGAYHLISTILEPPETLLHP